MIDTTADAPVTLPPPTAERRKYYFECGSVEIAAHQPASGILRLRVGEYTHRSVHERREELQRMLGGREFLASVES